MKSQVLHTVWCHISGEAAGEIWNWSLSVMQHSCVHKQTLLDCMQLLAADVAVIQPIERDGKHDW